eukprot:8429380-Pyramimonas_sp.AAC.1
MASWVDDEPADVWLKQFVELDLASDIRAHRSKSANLSSWGNTRALQSCSSRRQTATSYNILEAEVVSADRAVRGELLPALP